MEMVQAALIAEEEKKRLSRENFLFTSLPITVQAAYEPALYHAAEDHDDGMDNFFYRLSSEISLLVRSFSLSQSTTIIRISKDPCSIIFKWLHPYFHLACALLRCPLLIF